MSKAEEIADRVAQLAGGGLGRNAIARELGCAPATVTAAAKIAGISFDQAATAPATEKAQQSAQGRREELVARLYKLEGAATARLAQALAADDLDGRALVTLVGVLADKIAKLEPPVDATAADRERASQALEDLMTAIENSVDGIDEDEFIRACTPPGADPRNTGLITD